MSKRYRMEPPRWGSAAKEEAAVDQGALEARGVRNAYVHVMFSEMPKQAVAVNVQIDNGLRFIVRAGHGWFLVTYTRGLASRTYYRSMNRLAAKLCKRQTWSD